MSTFTHARNLETPAMPTSSSSFRVGFGRAGRTMLVAASFLLITSFVAGEVTAQTLSTGRGRTRGRIFANADKDPVPGASITLTYVQNGDVYTVEGEDSGVWVKGNMGFGPWQIEISAPGFLTYSEVINVRNVGRDYVMETFMTPGTDAPPSGDTQLTELFTGELGEGLNAVGALMTAGDFAGALAGYEGIIAAEAAKAEPNGEIHYVHLNAGNAAFEMADYAKAAAHYSALIERVPDNVDARLGLAKTYMMERRTDEAVAALDGLDLTNVMDPIVFYNIGSLLFDQGQSAEAATYYQRAVERDPSFADAYMQLGLCFIQQGKMTEAKPHLEKVIELDPGSENAALAQEFLAMVQG